MKGPVTHVLVGAGGFGKEVMPFFREMFGPQKPLLEFADDKLDGQTVLGYPVRSLRHFGERAGNGEYIYFNIAIGKGAVRAGMRDYFEQVRAIPINVVSPLANIQDGASISEGLVLCPFATINASARVGRFFQGNMYSYIAHDCIVEDYVTLAPGAKINGHCRLGHFSYVGTGAILLPGIEIGHHALIGAGAVVTKSVPAYETWAGVPAKKIK